VRLGPADVGPTLARAEAHESPDAFTSSAPMLARSATAPGPTIARTAAAGPTIARATGSGGGASGDSYEQFLERLRRDLLRERELYGDLLGDLP
jgi:hypothetical protein